MTDTLEFTRSDDENICRLENENAALRAEVARLREERRWIPVAERMPEAGVPVLAIWGNGYGVVRAYLREWSFGDMYWRGPGELRADVGTGAAPTHWMPMPSGEVSE